jgi:hypothetical protein
MANDISANPWRIDTAPFSYPYPVKITNLNINDVAGTDHVQIKDINGKIIVDYTGNTAEDEYRIGGLGWVRGIVVSSGGLGASAIVTIAVGAGK